MIHERPTRRLLYCLVFVRKFREWAAKKLVFLGYEKAKKDLQQGVDLYTIALRYDANNAETYYWRSLAYDKLNDDDAALADIKNAIRLYPKYFEAYRMLDYLLAKEKNWSEIISYWDQFLALEPENAAAILSDQARIIITGTWNRL